MEVLSRRERHGCVGYGGGFEVDRDLGAGEVEMFFGREDGSCEEVPVFETSTLSGLDLRGLCCMVLPVKRGSLLLGGGVLELFEDRTRCSGSLSLGASRRGLRSTLSLLTCMLAPLCHAARGDMSCPAVTRGWVILVQATTTAAMRNIRKRDQCNH